MIIYYDNEIYFALLFFSFLVQFVMNKFVLNCLTDSQIFLGIYSMWLILQNHVQINLQYLLFQWEGELTDLFERIKLKICYKSEPMLKLVPLSLISNYICIYISFTKYNNNYFETEAMFLFD